MLGLEPLEVLAQAAVQALGRRRRQHDACVHLGLGHPGQQAGEIEDEFDTHEEMIEEINPGEMVVNGECEVKQINRTLGLSLPEENVTIGGLVVEQLEAIPSTGTNITINDVNITVEKSSKRRVKKVRLKYKSNRNPDREKDYHDYGTSSDRQS